MSVLVKPGTKDAFQAKSRVLADALDLGQAIKELHAVGAFSEVHLTVIDGKFEPGPHFWTSGPDEFELEIGNYLHYSVPLLEKGDRFQKLKEKWLPYYGDALREKRLERKPRWFTNNLKHVPLYAKRGLVFQAFHRLYLASQEFLQMLFIKERTYPICYTKWIEEQLVDILGLPDLFPRFKSALEFPSLDEEHLLEKEELMWRLGNEYLGIPKD